MNKRGTWPAIDHSLLSPSGHISKRAREAANERLRIELFGPDGLAHPTCPQPTEREYLERKIREFRDLAARGIGPSKHAKEADRLQRQLDMLDA